jgi:hypothetical protein
VERTPFQPQTYTEQYLPIYLAYYFTTNVGKVQLLLLELARRGCLPEDLVLVDVGVGTGTTAVAALDFLVAWANVCDLYGEPFPIRSVRLVGFDVNAAVLSFARRVVGAFADALEERGGGPAGNGIFQRMAAVARACDLRLCDLGEEVPPVGSEPTLLVASNVLNELDLAGRENLGSLIAGLAEGSLALLIEPGALRLTRAFNGWRRDLIRRHVGLLPLLPCGEEFGRDQPGACGGCWNARREHLHPTLLYKEFREKAAVHRLDRRPRDEWENYLLSWSYTVLTRVGSLPPPPTPGARLSGNQVVGALRYIGKFCRVGNEMRVAAEVTDEPAGTRDQDYFKFCPAGVQGCELPGLAWAKRAEALPCTTGGGNNSKAHLDMESPA